jgi:hypothetical protein
VGAIIVPAADYSAFRVRVTNLGDATAALDLDRAQSAADGASVGGSVGIADTIDITTSGGSSAVQSFTGYKNGAVTIELSGLGSNNAVVQLQCRDAADAPWVSFGSQMTIVGTGATTVDRLIWSDRVAGDLRLVAVALPSGGSISNLWWRFGA